MATISFDLVSPENLIFNDEVGMIIVPGKDGDFGVLPGHSKVMSSLRPGRVMVYGEGKNLLKSFFVSGGFAEVNPEKCIVLAESVDEVNALDKSSIEKEIQELSGQENDMAKEQLEYFTAQLNEQKAEALTEIEDARHRLRVPPECKDEADRASFEMDSQLYLRIVDRKSKLVKKIDFALRRIKTGEYGYCMETGEPIGIERLIIRPTAEFCADIKYINDDQEKHFAE